MIISRISGGLGNQMFQYALARHLSHKTKRNLKLDLTLMRRYNLREVNIKKFNISAKDLKPINLLKYYPKSFLYNYCNNWLTKRIKRNFFANYGYIEENLFRNVFSNQLKGKDLLVDNMLIERVYSFDEDVLQVDNDVLVMGYYLSEKYFCEIRDILLKEFTLKKELDQKNKIILGKIIGSNSVSVHIRRGDYIKENNKSIFLNLDVDYYNKAISRIINTQSEALFFFFSDDIDWARKTFANSITNAIFVTGNDNKPEIDLKLMSSCKHNITANSTFSWWGAWLNDNKNKIVITPTKWFNLPNHDQSDLVPESWIKI